MKKAVIFDMDGVISDTQNLHEVSESITFGKHGIKITPGQIRKEFTGRSDQFIFNTVFKKFNKPLNFSEASKEKYTLMTKLKNYEIKPIDGVIEYIKDLKKIGIKIAVASSAPKDFIQTVIQNLKVSNYFDAMVSGDEVQHGKPEPDIFLYAAEKIKAAPQDCIVIEDAPNGIKGAKLAKMLAVGITTTHTKKQLLQADLIIDSFKDIAPKKLINL